MIKYLTINLFALLDLRKNFFLELLGLLYGGQLIKLTKDRSAREKIDLYSHTHDGNSLKNETQGGS